VFRINEDEFTSYFQFLNVYPQLKFDLIEKSNSPMNLVHLFFEGENLNFECYQSTAPKIQIKNLIEKIPTDTNFLINMISGFEIDLEDLNFIRKNFSGKIYFDFHTLTRGMNEEGKRVYRPLSNWREWAKLCDVIQMNEMERENLTEEKFSEFEFALEALNAGTKIINITKGSKGAITYFEENGEIKNITVEPAKNLIFKSNVGCGDIFGAVFAYNYFRNEKIETCLKKAVEISSKRIEIEKIENIIEYLHSK
ncbi:MAG: carbohydrate kinase family protein, partial [Ignavibacteria bacterium]|nr:carbohydrate kinase family protein [Ignavibacteria bacterium]